MEEASQKSIRIRLKLQLKVTASHSKSSKPLRVFQILKKKWKKQKKQKPRCHDPSLPQFRTHVESTNQTVKIKKNLLQLLFFQTSRNQSIMLYKKTILLSCMFTVICADFINFPVKSDLTNAPSPIRYEVVDGGMNGVYVPPRRSLS